jgi:hypothetical protein
MTEWRPDPILVEYVNAGNDIYPSSEVTFYFNVEDTSAGSLKIMPPALFPEGDSGYTYPISRSVSFSSSACSSTSIYLTLPTTAAASGPFVLWTENSGGQVTNVNFHFGQVALAPTLVEMPAASFTPYRRNADVVDDI